MLVGFALDARARPTWLLVTTAHLVVLLLLNRFDSLAECLHLGVQTVDLLIQVFDHCIFVFKLGLRLRVLKTQVTV